MACVEPAVEQHVRGGPLDGSLAHVVHGGIVEVVPPLLALRVPYDRAGDMSNMIFRVFSQGLWFML